MKRMGFIEKLKRPFLYSAFPIGLFLAYGSLTGPASEIASDIGPVLGDTLPGDTTDPMPADTMGYPGDTLPSDTSAYPTEDFTPSDTTEDVNPVDTAGSGEGFAPDPVEPDPLQEDTIRN